jgi:hypothetical protein
VVHDRLVEMAARRGTSLAATAADLLAAAVEGDGGGAGLQPDGALVAAVRAALAEVTAPEAVVYRELAVRLARAVERGERGAVAAAQQLTTALDRALRAQHQNDNPGGGSLDALLAGFSF